MTATTESNSPPETTVAAVLTPIPGDPLDPEPKDQPKAITKLTDRKRWAAAGWQAVQRFKAAKAPLIAGGTAYYAFLAMFSLLAFAYGIVAIVSADQLAQRMTDALEEALPGLVGENGIDPAALERVGKTASIVGLLLLAYSGSAVMSAASDSLHHIYGAPADGRNPLRRRLHLFGWLVIVGPLIAISYTLSTSITGFANDILDDWGIENVATRAIVITVATALTFALDVGIMALVLGRLGGIKPDRRAVLAGAVLGAAIVTIFKVLMAQIISWSVDKPEYGSFAIPIAVLVVLWFQSMGLYGAASLTAGVAETRGATTRDD